jgi:hypothetical protein
VEVILQLSSSLCNIVANQLPADGSPPTADVTAAVAPG